jgi:hypothetical protein
MYAVRKQLYAHSVMKMTCTHPSRGLHVVSRAGSLSPSRQSGRLRAVTSAAQ